MSDLLAWVKTRPPMIRALMRRFPPRCLVRATTALVVPAPGYVGDVVGYQDPRDDAPAGLVVVYSAKLNLSAEVEPDNLVLVDTNPCDTAVMAWLDLL